MGPVIVTNAKSRIAYNIVRSLGKKGITTYTSDFVPLSMSFVSRYSKGHFMYPSPFKDEEEFINCILDNINKLKAEVLIPVFEETFLISKYKDKFSKHVKMVVPDYDQVLTAHNKDKWEPIAKELRIPIPESYSINDLINGRYSIEELNYPVLIKPKQGGGGWAISQINSPNELEALLSQKTYIELPWKRFFIQEKIDGETCCVAMLFCKGEYRAKVAYKQLRDYPINGGQATLRISLRCEQAEDSFQKLLEELEWHGICQADFVVDKKNKVPYLIDINPRFWGSLAQGIASGVDFPYLLYKIAINGDVETIKEFKTGVKSRWLGGDLRTFYPFLKLSSHKLGFIKKFVFPDNGRIFYDDFSLVDPLPFFVWFTDAFIKMLKYRSTVPVSHDSLEGIWE